MEKSNDNNKQSNLFIRCIDCGNTFQFTEQEQLEFRSKNLHLPKRCNYCRSLRNYLKKETSLKEESK